MSIKIKKSCTITRDAERAIDVLAQASSLSKAKLKDAMNKGAVQLLRKGKSQRLRRATAELLADDIIELCYDDDLLSRTSDMPVLLADYRRYSVWYKPAGVLAQGNEWGDHCAMSRLVELHFNHQRKVLVVHRLDREARGIMMLAHDSEASAKLSQLFQLKKIDKQYQITVRGEVAEQGEIAAALDGKPSLTRFVRYHHDSEKRCSSLTVNIDSGRKHQIRRHFDGIGHPVLGDPLYGEDNHDERGLQLVAVRLQFVCPLTRQTRIIELSDELKLFK